MSIKVTSLVWEHHELKGTKFNVMLAIADWADDEGGRIYPSIERLARKARCSERSAQTALRELEDEGYIEKVSTGKGGRGKTTNYQILLDRIAPERAQNSHPLQTAQPKKGAKSARKGAAENAKGATDDSAIRGIEPSGEPLEEPPESGRARQTMEKNELPDWVPVRLWKEFEEFRRKIRKPLTPTARYLAVKKLEKLRDEGLAPDRVMANVLENGWQGIYPPKGAYPNKRDPGDLPRLTRRSASNG